MQSSKACPSQQLKHAVVGHYSVHTCGQALLPRLARSRESPPARESRLPPVSGAWRLLSFCLHTGVHTHICTLIADCPFVSHPFLCWYLLPLVVPWKWHPRKQRHNLLATLHHSAPSSACCRTAFSMRCDDGRRRSRCVDETACQICAWPSPAAFTTGACTPSVLRFPFYLLVRAPSPFSPSAHRSPGAARR